MAMNIMKELDMDTSCSGLLDRKFSMGKLLLVFIHQVIIA
jgi:hypothetical protein